MQYFKKDLERINEQWNQTISDFDNSYDKEITTNGQNKIMDPKKEINKNNDLKDLDEKLKDYYITDLPLLLGNVESATAGLVSEQGNTSQEKADYYSDDGPKEMFLRNKDKIHGAIIQAKHQNENYNNLVTGSINLICGILIVCYLIYKIYSPITIEEVKNTVKQTKTVAQNVATQAKSTTNKMINLK